MAGLSKLIAAGKIRNLADYAACGNDSAGKAGRD